MTVFVALLLAVLSVALVAYPFFRSGRRVATPAGDRRRGELNARRVITDAMLQELQSDYQSGILTEKEYRELESSYRQKADAIVRDTGQPGKVSPADDEIEKRVRELRQKRGTPQARPASSAQRAGRAEDEIEQRVRELRKKQELACAKCGQSYRPGDRFCAQCGAPLSQGGGR